MNWPPVGLVSCGSVSDASFPGTSWSSEPPAPCGPAGGERRSLCWRRPGGDSRGNCPPPGRVPSGCRAQSLALRPVRTWQRPSPEVRGRPRRCWDLEHSLVLASSSPSVTPWSAVTGCRTPPWRVALPCDSGLRLQSWAPSAVVGSEPTSWVLAATWSARSRRRQLLWGRVRTGLVGGWPGLILVCLESRPLTLHATGPPRLPPVVLFCSHSCSPPSSPVRVWTD